MLYEGIIVFSTVTHESMVLLNTLVELKTFLMACWHPEIICVKGKLRKLQCKLYKLLIFQTNNNWSFVVLMLWLSTVILVGHLQNDISL